VCVCVCVCVCARQWVHRAHACLCSRVLFCTVPVLGACEERPSGAQHAHLGDPSPSMLLSVHPFALTFSVGCPHMMPATFGVWGSGNPLFLGQQSGDASPAALLARRRIVVNGHPYTRCLSMHPVEGSVALVDFDVAGFFDSFTFAVGINDDVEYSLTDIEMQVWYRALLHTHMHAGADFVSVAMEAFESCPANAA
jgi:hypothetical protein